MGSNKFTGPCLYGSENIEESIEKNEDFLKGSFFNASITNCKINVDDDPSSFNGNGYIDINIKLKCNELIKLINSGDVSFFTKIFSSKSKLNQCTELTNKLLLSDHSKDADEICKEFRIPLPVNSMIGKSTIEVAAIAKKNSVWEHYDLEYQETIEITLNPGRVCAYYLVSPFFEIRRENVNYNINSIFVLQKGTTGSTDKIFDCRIDDGNDHIVITINQSVFNQIAALEKSNSTELLSALILQPALANILSSLYEKGSSAADDCKETVWYQSIERSLIANNVKFPSTDVSDALLHSEILMGSPFSKILGSIND